MFCHDNYFNSIKTLQQKIYTENTELCKTVDIPLSTVVHSFNVFSMSNKLFDSSYVEFLDLPTDAAVSWVKGYRNIVVMNFANREYPGGGYTNGEIAQEEECCRCFPTLYESLSSLTMIDNNLKTQKSAYPFHPTDVIVTPNVKLMRLGSTGYQMLNDKNMINAYIVTAAAPNLRVEKFNKKTIALTLRTTFLAPIKTFELNTPENNCLILGAWGCGAFRGNPIVMSKLIKTAVEIYGGYYGKIIFAIPDAQSSNYCEFVRTFLK
jgi:uncharacterized protein (TIGR02452 family)